MERHRYTKVGPQVQMFNRGVWRKDWAKVPCPCSHHGIKKDGNNEGKKKREKEQDQSCIQFGRNPLDPRLLLENLVEECT